MAKKQFKSESKRLLDLMVNSIYTKKEIFLRELISNASDAIDKLAYLALTDSAVGMARDDFAIQIIADKPHRTLFVSDNGIGMDREDLENNLGVIARSGSSDFKQGLEGEDAPDIIGQFGVGFYSVFMVAEKVSVITKKYGSDTAYKWESSGADGYTVSECEKQGFGSDIVIKLREDTEDENYSRFLEEYELRSLIKKYSDFIRFPIKMEVTRTKAVDSDDAEGEKQTETFTEIETINSMVPVWQRAKSEVGEEDYKAFYREQFYDFEDPLLSVHSRMEGNVSFNMLIFVPSKAPYDYFTKEYKRGLRLYSNGVMIIDSCEELLPEHFRFVKGVVDSPDVSLNISREMLQQDRQLKVIYGRIEKKIKSELLKLLEEDREKYEKFFAAFGVQLKYGVVSDYGAHKDLLADLLLFWSAREGRAVTLAEYAAAMPEGQEKVYFASGGSRERLAALPQTLQVTAKGYDTLLFTDEVDEFVAQFLREVDGKAFCNVSVDDLGLQSEEEKAELAKKADDSKDLLEFVKNTLGDSVSEVRIGAALGERAAGLVPGGGLSFEMEKYFKKVNPDAAPKSEKILELNASHPVFAALEAAIAGDPDKARDYAMLLFSQAMLLADMPLDDPESYARLVWGLMQ